MGEQRWSSLEGPVSSLKVGQDGVLMVHRASPRAVLCTFSCSPVLVPGVTGLSVLCHVACNCSNSELMK